MPNLFDAFISYGRADSKAFATNLHHRLLEAGLKIWFDQNDIPLGVDFQNQIDDGIEKSHNFLFIIAPHSVNSAYCLKEIELAIKLRKRIIPLLHVEAISRETWKSRFPQGTEEAWQEYKAKGKHTVFQNMHSTISKINWVYFREEIDNFEQSLSDLIELFACHRDYVEQHTQLLAKATEWERNKKQTSCLLIGEERQQGQAWLKKHFQDEQAPCVPTDLHCEYITESIKNANNLMSEVLISYADDDRGTMEKIRKSLRRESITVWTNRTDIQTGEDFSEAIKRGIEQTDNLVYLLSPASVTSTYCQQELDLAVSLNKRIIPVLVYETDPKLIPDVMRQLQYIDLTDNVKEEGYQLDESQLLRIINQEQAYYNEHKIFLTKALKWKRQNENPSILLRGYNLRSAETWLKVAKKRKQHLPTSLQEEFITQSLRQPPLESLDVFISYSRADSDLARKLNEELQLQGKTTWFDQESIASGSDFQQEIYQGIKVCDNFLFIISPRSVNSPYCADEVEYAASLNKRFVTVLHRQVNTADLHPQLAKVQWIDFNQHNRDFNANFHQLVRTLDTDRGHLRSHSKWLQRALEWGQKGKTADLLLRGSEFLIAQNWLEETEQQHKQPAANPLQKEFIEASQKAIEAAEEEEKRRQVEILSLQEARLAQQKKSLAAISMLLVASVGVSIFAFTQWKLAEKATQRALKVIEDQIKALGQVSLLLAKSNQEFDALVEAIRAGGLLKKNVNTVKPELESPILSILQAEIYREGFKERNRLIGHTDKVYKLAFSPDGKTLATGSFDNTVKLWNLQGEDLDTLRGHTSVVIDLAFSPDGKTLASASSDRTVKLWNLQGEELHTLTWDTGWFYKLAFSPDGKTLASASDKGTVKLWNLQGEELHTLTGHTGSVDKLAFSPDGKTLATGSSDQTVKLWNLQGEELHTLTGHTDLVSDLAFSPDGKTLATGSSDQTVKLWNLQGEEIKTLSGHEDWVRDLAFSPDGKTLASASSDRTVKLWNLQGEELHTLTGHTGKVSDLAFSPDGKTLASASSDQTVKLWNLQGEELHTLTGHTGEVSDLAFSPDGKTLASASSDQTVKLWNLQGKEFHTLTGHTGEVSDLALSPDGKTLASASSDQTVKLWNLQGEELHTLTGHTGWVFNVTFSPDGKTLASASSDQTVKLWNLQGKELHTLRGHQSSVADLAFSPDGKTLASASSDQTVKLWNLQGKELHTLRGHQSSVADLAFSPDGKTLASASSDRTVKLWNLQGKELHTLRGHQSSVADLAFSPDGKTLASASSDQTVKLWNLQGKELHTLRGHKSLVSDLAFSPDGKTLASASSDRTAKLWNLQGKELHTLRGHQSSVADLAFSPDGKTLATGSFDNTVKLWNLQGEEIKTLSGHEDWVRDLAFSPDGKTLVSASEDQTVILWNLTDFTLDLLMQDACAWVGDYLQHNAPESDKALCDGINEGRSLKAGGRK
ncbi:MAG: TIR domain-containing protein [Symploca sp. SIO1C4]|uniref:TIR domain-containing protein n=1 Tax=Symploca sp. SIO1C4 TaxID=2607765 RepID=A0A6B3N6T5_9CYAN|nr:TIR domain-containing protein [Symploca sp. SIO1C4]